MKETYEEFIDNILNTRGRFECGDEYHERHHIVPKCMGGGNETENLIDLYAREHFIAHKLLALENPENDKLTYAWNRMCNSKNGNYQITAEEYEKARIAFSKFASESKKGKPRSKETCDKLSKYMKTQWENPEWRKNMLEKLIPTYENHERNDKLSKKAKERFKNPENHPMYGSHMSEKSKRKNSESHKGKIASDETRKKQSEAQKSRWTEEARRKHGEIQRASWTKERREEQGKRFSGKNNPNYGNHKLAGKNHPNYGIPMSEEQKKKLSIAAQGKYVGENNPRARKVIRLSDSKIYGYIMEAAQNNGVTRDTIRRRCEKHQGFMFYDEWITQQNDLNNNNNDKGDD